MTIEYAEPDDIDATRNRREVIEEIAARMMRQDCTGIFSIIINGDGEKLECSTTYIAKGDEIGTHLLTQAVELTDEIATAITARMVLQQLRDTLRKFLGGNN